MMQNLTKNKYGIELRSVQLTDLRKLRKWRNSKRVNSQMLNTTHITPKKQIEWFKRINSTNDELHFAVWYRGQLVGYMNIIGNGYLYKQDVLDAGMYVGETDIRHGLLGYAISLIQLDIIFDELLARRVETKVKTDSRAFKYLLSLGFKVTDKKILFCDVRLEQSDYKKKKKYILKYFK